MLAVGVCHGTAHQLAASPIEAFSLRGTQLLVKRDDRLALGSGVSGNKARKLLALEAMSPGPSLIGSFGGHQSNAMAALAAVADAHGARFLYFTKPLPRWLAAAPSGNLERALSLGMELVELADAEYASLFGAGGGVLPAVAPRPPAALLPPEALWLPQGGAAALAEPGVATLAREVREWWQPRSGRLDLVVPAGTGTTALFLARHLSQTSAVTVWAVPCVGDGDYIEAQMLALDRCTGGAVGTNRKALPRTLAMPGGAAHHFGALDGEELAMWQEAARAGLDVDLLYAPHALRVLFDTLLSHERAGEGDATTLYLHTGGLEGVESQLRRYRRGGWEV